MDEKPTPSQRVILWIALLVFAFSASSLVGIGRRATDTQKPIPPMAYLLLLPAAAGALTLAYGTRRWY